jgi:multicomponent Na+:H+ antiporter subunit D
MGLASFFCIFIGVAPGWLYEKLPFPVDYHPYSAYHLSESMQLLAFTALGFYLLRKKMKPESKLNLDVDWFYRKALNWVLRMLKRFLEPANEWVGEIYKAAGFRFALATANVSSAFDVKAIDGVVDGIAHKVRDAGDKVRHAQTGRIQQYIALATAIFFLAIALIASF